MRPLFLKLKNFIGIRDGLGKVEISIDFSTLPDGLIVFAAPNGSGKSTLLDSLSAYRLMPSRMNTRDSDYTPDSFSFRDQTYGQWEREFIFEMDGVTYRSMIVGNNDLAQPKQEAYLYSWDGQTYVKESGERHWQKYPGIDSKLSSYDRAVEEVCGSPSLFFTSVFRAQNAKALSDYSKGDINDIFIELLGISHLQTLSDKAHDVRAAIALKVDSAMTERNRLNELIGHDDEKREEHDRLYVDADLVAKSIETTNEYITDIQKSVNALDVKIKAQEEAIGGKADIEKEKARKTEQRDAAKMTRDTKVKALDDKILALTNRIVEAEGQIIALPALRAKKPVKDDLRKKLDTLTPQVVEIDKTISGINKAVADLQTTEKLISDKNGELGKKVQARAFALKTAKTDLENAQKAAANLKTVPCQKDALDMEGIDRADRYKKGCRFIADAGAAEASIPALETKVAELSQPDLDAAALKVEIDRLTKSIESLPGQRKLLTEKEEVKRGMVKARQDLETKLSTVVKELDDLPRLEEIEKRLPELRAEREAAVKEKTDSIGLLDYELNELQEEIDALDEKAKLIVVDPEIAIERERLVGIIASAQESIKEAQEKQQDLAKKIGAVEESLRQIDAARIGLSAVMKRIDFLNQEVSEWSVLEKAFGQSGICALEIDDAGPQVSSIANQLLEIHGGRFVVKVKTQEEKKSGKGQMKDVFDIEVWDNSSGEHKSIRRMSGGERTIVDDALTKAIAIYNTRASGKRFQTIFCDERDGSLDISKKKSFFAVKREVLRLGGYSRDYSISHTPELIGLADAVIHLGKDGVTITTN